MTAPTPAPDILSRKARQGSAQREVTTLTPTRALRLALARTADEMWGLPLAAQGVRRDRLDQDAALAQVAEGELILVMAADDGAAGLIVLGRQVLSALIEVQTLGAVLSGQAEGRAYTQTDGAMAWLYLGAVLASFADLLGADPLARQLGGYRLAGQAEDRRKAALFLDAVPHELFSAEVEIGGGARSGAVRLILPERDFGAPPMARAAGPAAGAAALRLVPTSLQAVLCALSLPLSRACALRPGDLLELPDCLDAAMLVAEDGTTIARARLGQVNGFRALRLSGGSGGLAGPVAEGEAPVPEAPGDAPAAAQTWPAMSGLDQDAVAEPAPEADLSFAPMADLEDDGMAGEADFAAMAGFDDLAQLADLGDFEEES